MINQSSRSILFGSFLCIWHFVTRSLLCNPGRHISSYENVIDHPFRIYLTFSLPRATSFILFLYLYYSSPTVLTFLHTLPFPQSWLLYRTSSSGPHSCHPIPLYLQHALPIPSCPSLLLVPLMSHRQPFTPSL